MGLLPKLQAAEAFLIKCAVRARSESEWIRQEAERDAFDHELTHGLSPNFQALKASLIKCAKAARSEVEQ